MMTRMSEMKLYTLDVNGVSHTVQLTADDAERVGAKPVPSARARPTSPQNKAQKAAGE